MKINKLTLVIAATLVSTSAFANPGPLPYAEDNYAEMTLIDSTNTTAKIEQTSSANGSYAEIEAFDAVNSSFQIYQYTDNNYAVIKTKDGATDYKKNEVIIEQTGNYNGTAVLMSGGTDKSDVHITTNGDLNGVLVELEQANKSEVIGNVTGNSNLAFVDIAYGDGNKVDFTQTGNNNLVDVDIMDSNGNEVYVDQSYDRAYADVYVSWSDNNVITVNQTYGDVAHVTAIGGGGNTMTVNQY